jgi:PTS system nitrogen regulatory IIA component
MTKIPRIATILLNLTPNNRRAVIKTLAQQVAHELNWPVVGIEAMMTSALDIRQTVMDHGVVIFDGLLPGLDEPYGLLAHLARPVAFDHGVQPPADLVAMIISPDTERVAHLQRTAGLVRRLHDPALLARWRGATSVDAVRALFSWATTRPSTDLAA